MRIALLLAGRPVLAGAVVAAAACGGGAGGGEDAFCDAARDERDVFTGDGGRQVSPAIIGTTMTRRFSLSATPDIRVRA